jgi:hypothetical protein
VETTQAITRVWRGARDLGPVLLVAITVALLSTLAGAYLDHVHQVDAEEISGQREYAAVPAADGTQVLTLADWGVKLTVPLAGEMPTLSYAAQSDSSVGLSTKDLAALGDACRASRNGLGSLVRMPAGAYAPTTASSPTYTYIATFGAHDYAYLAPRNDCLAMPGAGFLLNREESILYGALGTLSPL